MPAHIGNFHSWSFLGKEYFVGDYHVSFGTGASCQSGIYYGLNLWAETTQVFQISSRNPSSSVNGWEPFFRGLPAGWSLGNLLYAGLFLPVTGCKYWQPIEANRHLGAFSNQRISPNRFWDRWEKFMKPNGGRPDMQFFLSAMVYWIAQCFYPL